MSCPYCNSPVLLNDVAGNPWYKCGTTKSFRSASCVDREPLATELRNAQDRIKRLEEELMDTKNKHAVLVADVVLNEDRAERIKRLEEAGDGLMKSLNCGCPHGDSVFHCQTCVSAWDAWNKAKEAKP